LQSNGKMSPKTVEWPMRIPEIQIHQILCSSFSKTRGESVVAVVILLVMVSLEGKEGNRMHSKLGVAWNEHFFFFFYSRERLMTSFLMTYAFFFSHIFM